MEEKQKDIDIVLEIIDKLLKDIDFRTKDVKANAYTVRLTDYYAIELRDQFNRLDGEYNALIKIKNEIINILDKKLIKSYKQQSLKDIAEGREYERFENIHK